MAESLQKPTIEELVMDLSQQMVTLTHEVKQVKNLIQTASVEHVNSMTEDTVDFGPNSEPIPYCKDIRNLPTVKGVEKVGFPNQVYRTNQWKKKRAQKQKREFTWLPTSPSNILKKLITKGWLTPLEPKPIPNPLPKTYNESEYCQYHQGRGHTTDRCLALKHAIQDFLDEKTLIVIQNPLPNHSDTASTHVSTISIVHQEFDPSTLITTIRAFDPPYHSHPWKGGKEEVSVTLLEGSEPEKNLPEYLELEVATVREEAVVDPQSQSVAVEESFFS
ncbi:uncharacterized protein LOC143856601 [Tasmannia lanceolata]|uniref:uncharacterized protein LOC143856601 n=1 Tax=Tasmannia lanceolata TaxID=3420 RepID=UPI00406497F0